MGAIPVPSTISFADIYGPVPPGRKRGETSPSDVEKASGDTVPVGTKGPITYWLAMVGMLVLARLLWEKGS